MKLIECVPNFSEGRRKDVIDAIINEARKYNVKILNVHSDASHNRTDVTIIGEPEEVIQRFDFTVTKAYFKDKKTVIVDDALIEDVKRRRLIITSIPCPIAVAQRVTKYARKGFNIGVRELVKLFIEWDRRDQQYKNRLQELLSNPELTDEDFEELERLLRVD